MKSTYDLSGPEDLAAAADWLLREAGDSKIWCIEGPMGVGKTTLIASVCSRLGVEDAVSSPTYGLVNEYRAGGQTVYHFDLYRLKSIGEALDMGIETYLDSGSLCLIEWPEIIQPLLPLAYLQITLRIFEDRTRQLICEHVC